MNETQEELTSDWAQIRVTWAENHETVLHVPTRVAGRVMKLWDGNDEKWKDPNGVYITVAVLELDNGHAFVATEEENFLPLAPHEAAFFHGATQDLATFCSKLASIAYLSKLPVETAATLLSATLREQARQIEVVARKKVLQQQDPPT